MEEPNRAAFDKRWEPGSGRVANSGFLYLPTRIDWNALVDDYAGWLEAPMQFTEQTIVNVALRDAGALPLDADEFVLDYRDARSPRDLVVHGDALARHYVAPIRWKFWIRVAGGWSRVLASAVSTRWIGQV
jgi:hypothetical protein